MIINYTYLPESKVKNQDKVKFRLFNLDNYDCNFIEISVETKEDKRKINSSIMIPIKTKQDIDDLIAELKELKKKI